jgi:hypothetical protein
MHDLPRPPAVRRLFGPRDLFADPAEEIAEDIGRAVQRGEDLRPLLDRVLRLIAPSPRGWQR